MTIETDVTFTLQIGVSFDNIFSIEDQQAANLLVENYTKLDFGYGDSSSSFKLRLLISFDGRVLMKDASIRADVRSIRKKV